MGNPTFENAVNELYRAARDTGVNVPEPDAEHSERISDGWFLRDDSGEPITTVRDNGDVWMAYTSLRQPKAADSHLKPLDAKPEDAKTAVVISVSNDDYHIEFNDEVLDELVRIELIEEISSRMKAVFGAYLVNYKAKADLSRAEYVVQRSKQVLARSKMDPFPVLEDEIPF